MEDKFGDLNDIAGSFFIFLKYYKMDPLMYLFLWIFVYFIPTFVSWGRPRFWQVLVINLFLWWSVVGWVIALVMAMNPDNKKQENKKSKQEVMSPEEENILKIKRLTELYDEWVLTDEEYMKKMQEADKKLVDNAKSSDEDKEKQEKINKLIKLIDEWILTEDEGIKKIQAIDKDYPDWREVRHTISQNI